MNFHATTKPYRKFFCSVVFVLICYLGSAHSAFASISHDNSVFDSIGNSPTATESYTTSSCDNRVMYVWAGSFHTGGTSAINSVTYNGVALTQFSTGISFVSDYLKDNVWYLESPDAGTHDVVLSTPDSGAEELDFSINTYCGVKQEAPTNNDRYYNSSDENHDFALTTSANSWLVIVGRNRFGSFTPFGSGANVQRYSVSALSLGDSDTPLTAGSNTIGFQTGGFSEFGVWAWEIEDAGGTPPSPSGVEGLIATASTTIYNDLGFGLGDVGDLTKSNLLNIMGSALGILPLILPFILALVFISAVVYFIYRGFRFFNH